MEPGVVPLPVAHTPSEWVFAIAAGIAAAVLLIQKLMRGWTADQKERVIDSAEIDIVSGLLKELQRLREQNESLTTELSRAQEEAAKMAIELRQMTDEVNKLETKLKRLLAHGSEDKT
jgi:septal ring factor EnvC (AmiA/AmiB activator)